MSSIGRRIIRRAHHLRHRPIDQLCWRVWFALACPAPDLRPAPPLRTRNGTWCRPAQRVQGFLEPFRFRFLNVERELDSPAVWNDLSLGRRWLYDLHNFHYLTARHWQDGVRWHPTILQRWIAENPPARGIGWEPYPVSLRLVNWIKWALADNLLPNEAVHSLAVQTRHLRRRLERHIPGNHLLANAKALIFAGLFFEGDEADHWCSAGVRLMKRQLARQILPDGGHCERSPMYHSIVLEDCLDLLNLTRAYGYRSSVTPWVDVIPRMQRWLAALCHPDGQIAQFNDAAIGIAPEPAELAAYAARLGWGACEQPHDRLVHLADSGVVRLTRGPAVVLLDVGPLGPDDLPGHGHADTLTFELSLFGRRVVVDSGISTYDRTAERLRQRGTAAHNTVVVDGCDSSEVWDDFRVGRRARVFGVATSDDFARSRVTAAHDGYRRLGCVHRRSWELSDGRLSIEDVVGGHSPHDIRVVFHFHPEFRIRVRGANQFELTDENRCRVATVELDAAVRGEVSAGTHHPGFGVSLACQKLVGSWKGRLPLHVVTTVSWVGASRPGPEGNDSSSGSR